MPTNTVHTTTVAGEQIPAEDELLLRMRDTQQLLQVAVQGANIGVWHHDVRTKATYYSPEWKRQVGYEEHEIGTGLEEWEGRLHPEDRPRVMTYLEEFYRRRDSQYEVEFRLRHKDGSYRWILSRATMQLLPNGEPARFYGCHVDITERKLAEQRLRDNQEMLAKAQEIARTGSWEWDLATNKVGWSNELLRLFGIKPEKFGGSLEYVLMEAGVHPDDRAKLRAATERALATKIPQPLEYRIVRPDGTERIVWADGEFVFDQDGTAARMIGTIQDITEQKRAEEVLRQAHEELEVQVADRTRELQREIAERKRSQDALERSEAKFRTLAETMAVATFIFQGAKLLYANPGAEAITGYSREELLQKPFWAVIDPEFQPLVKERGFARQQGKEPASRYEVKLRTKNGESRWVDFTAGRIEFQGKPAILGTAFDITERKHTEEALLDSEAKHRAVLNAIPDSIVRFRLDGPLINFKPARGPVGESAYLGVSELAKQLVEYGRKAARSGETEIFEYQVQVNESVRDYEARIVASTDQEAVAILRDVTERKRMEKEILAISDHEKRRLGQDLHDGLCQHLTGTAFAAKVLEEKLAEKSLAFARDARELGDLIEQGITQARELARSLYPVQLEAGGLSPALEELARTITSLFRVSCQCDFEPHVSIEDRSVATHLYRIAQEAINNSLRHGKANRVKIAVTRSNGQIKLTIKDNGVGLPKTPKANKGIGLNIMRYRAHMIGASIEVQPARKGTVVTCSLKEPLAPTGRRVRRGTKKTA